MPKRFLRALRAFFHPDYSLSQGYLAYAAAVGSAGYVAFYFFESHLGYRDVWPLRIVCILLPLPILFFPESGRLSFGHKLYWELTGWFLLAVYQTLLFLLNKSDSYWDSSILMSGVMVGLLTKPAWFIPQLVSGVAAAIGIHTLLWGKPDPDTIKILLGLQANSAIAGILALCVQAGMQVFHRRGLELAEATARAQEARKSEEEIRQAYVELKRRETVITRFVRPSLFDEMVEGRDPTEFEPVERNLGVLFCDIREFTHLTEILGPREKQTFLNQYLSMMTHPIVDNGGEVDKIMGDCVMGIFPDGRSAALAAVDMRLELQEFNRRMFREGKPLIRNGIGIARGPVMLGNFGSYEKLDRTVIGEAVNIASRLESKTKTYNLEIVVTDEVVRDLDPGESSWRWIDMIQVKGSSRRLKIYEVYGHQPAEVRKYKDATRDMLEKALTIYFQKGFKDALRIFNAMLADVPPHLHASGELMDKILEYYVDRCRAWSKDDSGTWDLMQKWEGVHVFHEK